MRKPLLFALFVVITTVIATPLLYRALMPTIGGCSAPRFETDCRGLETVLMMCQKLYGRLPTTEEGLRVLVVKPKNWGDNRWMAMLTEVPKDPYGMEYRYVAPAPDGAPYGIYSCGPDRTPHTADDLESWKLEP